MTAGDEWRAFVDDYLADTGEKVLEWAAMHDWLAARPDHVVHRRVFARSDRDAARAWRISEIARNVRTLKVTTWRTEGGTRKPVRLPAVIRDPRRRDAGHTGHVVNRPTQRQHRAATAREASQALRAAVRRWRGIAELIGVDMQRVERTADALDAAAAKLDEPAPRRKGGGGESQPPAPPA